MVSLRLVPVSGTPIDVTRDQSLVGRDPGCEIVVSDGSVSRRHARLERRAGAWWVVDQGSANGTYVNSLKVAETALKDGQELRFGALAFRVDIGEDPEATVAAPILPEETVMATPPQGVPAPPAPTPPPAAPPPPIPQPAAATPPPPAPAGAPVADRFRPASAAPVPQMSGGAPPPKKGRGPFFWIAIGCCGCILLAALFGALGFGGAFLMTKGAADAVHEHLALVRAGDIDAAYAGLSDELRAQVSLQDYERLIVEHEGLRDNADATFFSRSMENDKAVLRGVLTTPSGQAEQVTVELVKQGGVWKITALRFDLEG